MDRFIDMSLFSARLKEVYPGESGAMDRCLRAFSRFNEIFGFDASMLFSAPGRTEIGGNHTDHNNGRVLAGSVNLDTIATVAKTDGNIVRIQSEGFELIELDATDTQMKEDEAGHSVSLVRGILAQLKRRGYKTGGFSAYTTTSVIKGSGLSSSAAFEVLVGCIVSHLYNEGQIGPVELSIIGRYAENEYFLKPCGLMDQIACATGGFVAIDFKEDNNPVVTPIPFDFMSAGHTLCIVDIRADHGELTEAYAAIPDEMRSVARVFGKDALRQVDPVEFFDSFALVRKKCSDRALLRAQHFFMEDERAASEAQALIDGDFDRFLELVNSSGRSSYMYLQNIYVEGGDMSVAVGLALSDLILNGRGAFRVHGGGFAGTIQAIVPNDLLDSYRSSIDRVFGEGSCYALTIRKHGAIRVF